MSNERTQAAATGTKRPRGRPPGRKPELTWQERLVLQAGEALRQSHREKKGNMDQWERELYDVIDAQGQIVGTVIHTTSMSIRPPFETGHGLVQRDLEGKAIIETCW